MQQDELSFFDARPPVASADRVLKVKDLARLVREALEENFSSVIVEGEISNFKRHMPSGHLYFTLKDDAAQVRVVMWRSDAARVRFDLGDGMKVIVKGRVSLYEPRGDFQLYASTIMPAGQGALQLAFEQLKKKLEAEGLFDESHKKPIPEIPARIGVVTSLEGAAVRDVISIVARRFPAVEVVIYPVKVQGDGAGDEVARAIRDFNRLANVDVLIIGRGGGSLEDLWAFNEEAVARAIYDSTIPTISAVGHQVDFTIADFVADIRAATPSAAAELVVPDRIELLERLQSISNELTKIISQSLTEFTLRLESLSNHYALQQPASLVDQKSQFVDDLSRRIQIHLDHHLDSLTQKLSSVRAHLNALGPNQVLKRGYAFVQTEKGVVGSVNNIGIGDSANVHLHDGTLITQVTGKDEQKR